MRTGGYDRLVELDARAVVELDSCASTIERCRTAPEPQVEPSPSSLSGDRERYPRLVPLACEELLRKGGLS